MSKAEKINEALEAEGVPAPINEVICALVEAWEDTLSHRVRKMDDSIQAIRNAVEANAAPMNVIFALKELASQGEHITLDTALLIDLFEAQSASS